MKIGAPKSLRHRMLILTLLIVTLPMFFAGYEVKMKAEEALLSEKQAKLFFVTRLMDINLGDGGYGAILKARQAEGAGRDVQIRVLNEALAGYTDMLAKSMPGLGVGYYNRELDAIITYGPSRDYAGNVGHSIAQSHPGRKVMEEGRDRVEFGTLVRGNIMNAMMPVVRAGRVEGYIWANELTEDISSQMATMNRQIYLFGSIGLLVSLMLMLGLTSRFASDVEKIKRGLDVMQFDLKKQVPVMSGEMGEIAISINQMAQAVLDARLLNENILYSISDGIITVGNDGRITMINQAAQNMTGFDAGEVVGRFYREVFLAKEKDFHSLLLDTLNTGTHHIGVELDYPVKNGYLHVSVSSSCLKDGHGNDIGAVVVIRDLTEQQQLRQQVLQVDLLASTDSMTGLKNRRSFLESLELFLLKAQEGKTEFSLAFLDLDDLKKVNDAHGHREGDWFITAVASLLRQYVREEDVVGRLGGDEFAIILPGCPPDTAKNVLCRIAQKLEELALSLEKKYSLSFSVGIIHVSDGEKKNVEELLSSADAAMYRQKQLQCQQRSGKGKPS